MQRSYQNERRVLSTDVGPAEADAILLVSICLQLGGGKTGLKREGCPRAFFPVWRCTVRGHSFLSFEALTDILPNGSDLQCWRRVEFLPKRTCNMS
jgi:hypothetical protein